MKNRYSWILIILLFFSSLDLSHALTKEDMEEIRIIVREVVKEEIGHVNVRIDDMNKSLNKRIDDVSGSLNKKIDDVSNSLNKKIDDASNSLNKRMDDMNDSLNRRINDLYSFILWGFGITWTGMLGFIGLILWDRRSAIRPVQRDVREGWDRLRKLEEILREYAKKDPELAAILKNIGV